MIAQPCTDFKRFLALREMAPGAVALSLMPDAALAMARRYGCGGADWRQKLQALLKPVGAEVFFDDSLMEARRRTEAGELLRRLSEPEAMPLVLCGCPCWQKKLTEEGLGLGALYTRPALEHRSRTLAIRSLVAGSRGLPFSRVAHVTVVCCAAQKESYCLSQGEAPGEAEEYVFTLRETALWLFQGGVAPFSGGEESPAVSAPGEEESQGRLGGVLSLTVEKLTGVRVAPQAFALEATDGHLAVRQGFFPLPGRTLRYAQVQGLHEMPWLRDQLRGRSLRCDLLEVFSCACCH